MTLARNIIQERRTTAGARCGYPANDVSFARLNDAITLFLQKMRQGFPDVYLKDLQGVEAGWHPWAPHMYSVASLGAFDPVNAGFMEVENRASVALLVPPVFFFHVWPPSFLSHSCTSANPSKIEPEKTVYNMARTQNNDERTMYIFSLIITVAHEGGHCLSTFLTGADRPATPPAVSVPRYFGPEAGFHWEALAIGGIVEMWSDRRRPRRLD